MARVVDYRQVSAFWNGAARAGRTNPDLAAALVEGRMPPEAHTYARRGQLDHFVEIIGDLPRSSAVLDLGCGPGLFSLEIADRVDSILGVDLAPPFVEAARAEAARRGVRHARFEAGSMVDPVPPGPFDLVVLGSVLQYVGDADLAKLLADLRGKLTPEGRIYIRVSCSTSGTRQRSGPYEAIYRSRRFYESLFREQGFDVVKAEPDRFYTYSNLLLAYFGVLRAVTLGLMRHRPHSEERLLRAIIRGRPILLEMPRRILAHLPTRLPCSRIFLLRRAAAS
jgi:SAM-dependent methyltransferase